jgi:hypothetical protein
MGYFSQQQYALELLELANMLNCNPIATPIDTKCKVAFLFLILHFIEV